MAQGSQFMAPNEDAIWVAEELGRRYGVPQWQFTLSATHANTEALRVARAVTGRQVVAFFDQHYHGHFDETLVSLVDGDLVPDEAGLPDDVTERVLVLPFNDVDALQRALSARSVAAVVTEYRHNSHADVIVSRLLLTDMLDGTGRERPLKLVSLFTDQRPANDISRLLAASHRFPIKASRPIAGEASLLGSMRRALVRPAENHLPMHRCGLST